MQARSQFALQPRVKKTKKQNAKKKKKDTAEKMNDMPNFLDYIINKEVNLHFKLLNLVTVIKNSVGLNLDSLYVCMCLKLCRKQLT